MYQYWLINYITLLKGGNNMESERRGGDKGELSILSKLKPKIDLNTVN